MSSFSLGFPRPVRFSLDENEAGYLLGIILRVDECAIVTFPNNDWIIKSRSWWLQEIHCSSEEFDNGVHELEECGLIEVERCGARNEDKIQLRVNFGIQSLLNDARRNLAIYRDLRPPGV